MIDSEVYREVLESGLTLDHYFLMCNIKNGVKPITNKRIQGFINLLTKKEYIKDDVLTDKAELLIANCEIARGNEPPEEVVESKVNMAEWSLNLHTKCETKLMALTGKKQARSKIGTTSYPFLPNARDLAKNIIKVMENYKLRDLDKIEQTVMRHIDACHKAGKWFPILKYYILKEGNSQLATDINDVDEGDDDKQQFKEIKTKELF